MDSFRPRMTYGIMRRRGLRSFSSSPSDLRHRGIGPMRLRRWSDAEVFRIEVFQFGTKGVDRRADLLFGMSRRHEEPQPRLMLFHRRIQDRLHVDPARGEAPAHAQTIPRAAHDTGNDRRAYAQAGVDAALPAEFQEQAAALSQRRHDLGMRTKLAKRRQRRRRV